MKKSIVFFVLCSLLFFGCKPKDQDQWARVEAFIKQLYITNAGLSGGQTIQGVVDSKAFTVVFNDVPAETNIYAIRLDGKYSLGGSLDSTVYDFTLGNDPTSSTLTRDVRVNNYGDKHNTYKVTINLSDPASAPILEKLVFINAAGTEFKANVNNEDSTIYLNMEGEGSAILKEMVITPSRSQYEFSTMTAGVIAEDNPGELTMTFMGLTTKYKIDFTAGSAPGVDFTSAVVHDFSVATSNCPAYFAGELVRGSDFDGNHVLIVSRSDATTPTPLVYKVSDLLNDVLTPTALNVTDVTGGTHVVSAGRLSQGHIYICNLTTGITTDPLKVYHYATPTSAPEVVLSWDGTGLTNVETDYTGRIGDNISVNLDENGNGYAFFHKQEPGDKIYRFTVENFTTFSDPYEIDLEAVASYYGYVNEIADEPGNFVFTSSYVPWVRLMNEDGENLYELEFDWTNAGARPNHGVDPRVITFNRARYLMFTVANSQGMHWNFGPVLYIMDITDGFNTLAAFAKLDERIWPEEGESTFEPDYEYFIGLADGTTTASACSAQCNAAMVNGKLVVYTAGANAGFALIEFSKAKK